MITGNTAFGVFVQQITGTTECTIENCVIAHNGTGLVAQAGTPRVRLSDTTAASNTVGIQLTSGTVASYGNNPVAGNGSGNAPSPGANIPLQ